MAKVKLESVRQWFTPEQACKYLFEDVGEHSKEELIRELTSLVRSGLTPSIKNYHLISSIAVSEGDKHARLIEFYNTHNYTELRLFYAIHFEYETLLEGFVEHQKGLNFIPDIYGYVDNEDEVDASPFLESTPASECDVIFEAILEKYEIGFTKEDLDIFIKNGFTRNKNSNSKKINSLDEVATPDTENSNLGRREIQVELIQAVIKALNYEPLKIPDGGKAAIKKICIERNRIFTDSGFDHAWKDGLRRELFKLENNDKYSSKTNLN